MKSDNEGESSSLNYSWFMLHIKNDNPSLRREEPGGRIIFSPIMAYRKYNYIEIKKFKNFLKNKNPYSIAY
jgi:hypothetical protein